MRKNGAMKIVVSGVGEMGSHLARMLSGNGHEITVIESDAKRLSPHPRFPEL